jgi:hypothetical protein
VGKGFPSVALGLAVRNSRRPIPRSLDRAAVSAYRVRRVLIPVRREAMIPIKLVLVKKTGKNYLYNGEHRDIVVCKGEVVQVQGLSLTHGPDKKFKREAVEITEVDLTEQLANQLRSQSCPDCENGSGWNRHLENNDEVVEACKTCRPEEL